MSCPRSHHTSACPRGCYGWQSQVPDLERRDCWIAFPEYQSLNMACAFVNKAFGEFGCYLVGSATRTRQFRDVDVRFIMEDAHFKALFAEPQSCGAHNPRWSLICGAISEWLSKRTGLNVDFQIQSQRYSQNNEHGLRVPLGLQFTLDYWPEPEKEE